MSGKIRLAMIFMVLIFTASCASTDCTFDLKAHPDPIYVHMEDGAVYGQNYVACFIEDGYVYKEYLPECAYRYYYDRLYRTPGR